MLHSKTWRFTQIPCVPSKVILHKSRGEFLQPICTLQKIQLFKEDNIIFSKNIFPSKKSKKCAQKLLIMDPKYFFSTDNWPKSSAYLNLCIKTSIPCSTYVCYEISAEKIPIVTQHLPKGTAVLGCIWKKKCQCKDKTSLGILSSPIPTLINTQAEWQALAASMIRCSLVCPKLRRVHAIIHPAKVI